MSGFTRVRDGGVLVDWADGRRKRGVRQLFVDQFEVLFFVVAVVSFQNCSTEAVDLRGTGRRRTGEWPGHLSRSICLGGACEQRTTALESMRFDRKSRNDQRAGCVGLVSGLRRKY